MLHNRQISDFQLLQPQYARWRTDWHPPGPRENTRAGLGNTHAEEILVPTGWLILA